MSDSPAPYVDRITIRFRESQGEGMGTATAQSPERQHAADQPSADQFSTQPQAAIQRNTLQNDLLQPPLLQQSPSDHVLWNPPASVTFLRGLFRAIRGLRAALRPALNR